MTSRPANKITTRATLIGFAFVLALCTTLWAASEEVLYRFHGKDGWSPNSVMLVSDGALYGTTTVGGIYGGASYGGVVFQLIHKADGKWHETVLHSFDGKGDGNAPSGPLVADKSGDLYGTTEYGGSNGCSGLGCGVVFELVRGTGGKWTYKILYLFDVTHGAEPYGGLIFDSQGNLYGTASIGGNTSTCGPPEGCGLVFKLSSDGKGNWTETVLYSFSGQDGAFPYAPLTLDAAGKFYGTTEWGGAFDAGTVFQLSPGGSGNWTEEVLHSFSSETKDGGNPSNGVSVDSSGNLYGTTPSGGTKGQQGWGTAFKLTPKAGGKWKETILRAFDRAKFGGGDVTSGLTLDANGNFYGTTNWGGRYNCPLGGGLGCGVVFSLTQQKNGKWDEAVLHSFGKGDDGAFPGGLALDSLGNLFGVGLGGHTGGPCGQGGCGVIFEITP